MHANLSEEERFSRVLIGLAIGAIAISYNSWWGLIGVEVILTGLFGWSPIYKFKSIII